MKIKAKQLEWEKDCIDNSFSVIERDKLVSVMEYCIMDNGIDRVIASFPDTAGKYIYVGNSIDDAKQACQDHFDKLISENATTELELGDDDIEILCYALIAHNEDHKEVLGSELYNDNEAMILINKIKIYLNSKGINPVP